MCEVTGTKPQTGNHVSHANNKVKRRFMPNIQKKSFWIPSLKKKITLSISAKGIRLIDKLGIEEVLQRLKTQKKSGSN